jgi:hypothetical protein
MIDEQELHDGSLHLFDFWRIGTNHHTFGDRRIAGRDRFAHFIDFDQTHAAIASR